jgi:hypothetical protein
MDIPAHTEKPPMVRERQPVAVKDKAYSHRPMAKPKESFRHRAAVLLARVGLGATVVAGGAGAFHHVTGVELGGSVPLGATSDTLQSTAMDEIVKLSGMSASQETNPNIIKVGDLHPGKPPTEKLNGTVTVIIDKEDNLPVPRTSPHIDGADNATSWLQISEINNQSVTKATDSNGQVELILTDPLITTNDSGIGSWVTVVGADGKPLYLFAGQETAGIVKEQPRGGKEDVFSPVPPTANALDFGKVSFQNAPPPTTTP